MPRDDALPGDELPRRAGPAAAPRRPAAAPATGSLFPTPAWIARAQNGDRTALRALIDRLQDVVVAHALALLGDERQAEQAGRASLVEALRRLGEMHDALAFPRWLGRIVERRCDGLERAAAGPRSPAGDPEQLLARVLALPKPEERAVTLLVHLAGCAPADVALFLGVAPSDVQSRLAIAHGRLKKGVVRRLAVGLEPLRPSRDPDFVEGVLASLPG